MAFFYGMALNLSLSAEDLAEQNRMNEAERMRGDVTEVSQGPEVDNKPIQMAGGSALGQLFKNLGKKTVSDVTPSNQPARVPTEQEMPLLQDNADYSLRKTQEEQSKVLLSPEGQKEFASQNFTASPAQDDLLSAQKALEEEISAAESMATDVNKQAKRALKADENIQASDPTKNVASEELTDKVLIQRQAAIDLSNDKSGFNFGNITSSDDVKNSIQIIAQQLQDPQNVVTRGIRDNKTTMADAAKIAADEMGFKRKLLSRKVGDANLNAEELVASRMLLVDSAQQLNDMAVKIESGQANALDRLRFRRQLAIHAGIQLQIKGAQTEAARALQSFRIDVGGEMDGIRAGQEAMRMLNETGANVTTETLAKHLLKAQKEGGLGAVNKFAENGFGAKLKKQVHEAYLAGLLWQTASQFKNILGSATFMLYQLPAEQAAGMYGAFVRGGYKLTGQRAKIPENQVYLNDAYLRIKGQMAAFKDAMKLGSIAFKTEMPASQVNRADLEEYKSIASGTDPEYSTIGRAIDVFGKVVRLPFRGMLTADEFFKTMSQRGELYTLVNQRYQHFKNQGFTDQQAADKAGMLALDPGAVGEQLDKKARYDTMMSDLGTFGKMSGMVQRTWVGRFLFPFVTAPTNSMLATSDFMPLFAPRTYADLLGKNGAKGHQRAVGKLAVGSASMFMVGEYAMNGQITGSMPQDKKVREALPKGWQPYSLVFRKNNDAWPKDENDELLPIYDKYGRPNGELTYVSYHGFEPVGAIIGITADIMQRMVRTRDPEMRENIVMATLASTADYYTQLPMLKGLSDITSALEDGNIVNLLRGPAEATTDGGFPISGLLRMINRTTDPIKTRTTVPVEYYTLADVNEKLPSGELRFKHPDGGPDFRMVGTAKNDMTTVAMNILKQVDAYNAKDSNFRDETQKNVVLYDTLGNTLGADDYHWATSPGYTLWNNITGIRFKEGKDPSVLENELMRVAAVTNGWPLTSPTNRKAGIKLSNKNISDWVNLSKNEISIKQSRGIMDFRDALLDLVAASPLYKKANDFQKASLVKAKEQEYLNAGFEALINLKGNEGLRKAYTESQLVKEEGLKR